jgi:hypothetical protein
MTTSCSKRKQNHEYGIPFDDASAVLNILKYAIDRYTQDDFIKTVLVIDIFE